MKKITILSLLLCVLMVFTGISFADVDYDDLLRTADSEIFVKAGFIQSYNERQGYINEFTTDNIIHQFFISDGKSSEVLTSLQPSPEIISVSNKLIKFDERRAKNFHVSYVLQRTESIPENSGYCFIRYSDTVMTGPGRGSGVIVYPGYKAFSFSPVDDVIQFNEIADLSKMDCSERIKVDVIRLDGLAYFYFNDIFVFWYEDGITNTVSFEGGTELFAGSNRIRCDFDDFTFISQ